MNKESIMEFASFPDAPAASETLNFESPVDEMRTEVFAGLAKPRKTLPCKLFYDERGSQLFDEICELPEYYPTRTELRIMRDHVREMAAAIGPRRLIVEYGSGSSLKTRVLLDHLNNAAGYVPIDISSAHLARTARALSKSYPHIPIHPVCADYTRPFQLPPSAAAQGSPVVAYFPGSTIGNFEPDEALTFLKSIRATCGPRSSLLVGVDLKKDPAAIHAAYNDAAGVTAAFNLNLLTRLNNDIGSDFKPEAFAHYAYYNPILGRVEMHLVSRKSQAVHLPGNSPAQFEEGEAIHTENCYKYSLQGFNELATRAGYRRKAVWTDSQRWFSVQYFRGD